MCVCICINVRLSRPFYIQFMFSFALVDEKATHYRLIHEKTTGNLPCFKSSDGRSSEEQTPFIQPLFKNH